MWKFFFPSLWASFFPKNVEILFFPLYGNSYSSVFGHHYSPGTWEFLICPLCGHVIPWCLGIPEFPRNWAFLNIWASLFHVIPWYLAKVREHPEPDLLPPLGLIIPCAPTLFPRIFPQITTPEQAGGLLNYPGGIPMVLAPFSNPGAGLCSLPVALGWRENQKIL